MRINEIIRTARRALSLAATAMAAPSVRPSLGALSFVSTQMRWAGTGGPARQRKSVTAFLRGGFALALALALALNIVTPAQALIEPGTNLDNTARATYTLNGATGLTSRSNTVRLTTVATRTDAIVRVLRHSPDNPAAVANTIMPPEYSTGDMTGPFTTMPPAQEVGGSAIDTSAPVPLTEGGTYHMNETVFLIVEDFDQNTRFGVADTVVVTITTSTGDTEIVRLAETGPNTGVFTGYALSTSATGAALDGSLNLGAESTFTVSYSDPADGTDTHSSTLVVDPFGVVFDSKTGELVDGASVSIMNATSGQPAAVFGDDGVSTFPSTVATGATVSDSSGRSYVLSAGSFRFPYVPAGNYRLVIRAAGYEMPSKVDTATLQTLPGAPYEIVNGSRGEAFTLATGGAIHIDVPVDPANLRLHLTKKASVSAASIGDFYLYTVTVEETNGRFAPNVRVIDNLPPGLRYQGASARLNGAGVPDPVISGDGRTLVFAVGDLGAGARAEVRYVVEVTAEARVGRLANSATGAGEGVMGSNVARAFVTINDEFHRESTIIMGRVIADNCGLAADSAPRGTDGVPGARIYLEDGTYVVTDKQGLFHFKALRPGTHVVQLDTFSLPELYEPVLCDDDTTHAGSGVSEFVDLAGGSFWRVDFHLKLKPRSKGGVSVSLNSRLTEGVVTYTVPVKVGDVPVDNARLTVILPEGITYLPGSSKTDGKQTGDPENRGGALTYRLGSLKQALGREITLKASVSLDGKPGNVTTKALLTFDTAIAKNVRIPVLENVLVRTKKEDSRIENSYILRTNFSPMSTELSRYDIKSLDVLVKELTKVNIDGVLVIGHTDSVPLRPGNGQFEDNYTLSRARAQAVMDYLARKLDLRTHQQAVLGMGPDEPIADNDTKFGRARNRRVEVKAYLKETTRTYSLDVVKDRSGLETVQAEGVRPGEKDAGLYDYMAGDHEYREPEPPAFDRGWLDAQEPGFKVVWPPEDYYPVAPTMKLSVKHEAGSKILLSINGKDVDPIYYQGTRTSGSGGVLLSNWIALSLLRGGNTITITELDSATGKPRGSITREIHVSTIPVKAELVPEESTLVADGRTAPVIAVRLTDKEGHPVRAGIGGEYSVAAPHVPLSRYLAGKDLKVAAAADGRTMYKVGPGGIVKIRLVPTTQTGKVDLAFRMEHGSEDVRAWLNPARRDWVLVGLAEGTAGYNMLSGNMRTLGELGMEDGLFMDGRAAFFAKGALKGSWLLSMAYDSAKPSYNSRNMHQAIDPEKYYTLYGDATEQGHEAPSARRLYVKLEREQFYALFGDFRTDFSDTTLARYNRSMNGAKTELNTDTVAAKAFVSESNHSFVRDEIPGDGTTGLYRLSRKDISIGTDHIALEVRDRFRSEVIISRTELAPYTDYDIDYDAGTVFFTEPVPVRDEYLNPVYIIAEYEAFDASDSEMNYGARVAVKVKDDKVVLGATHIHEADVGREGELTGVDVTVKPVESITIKAEAAETSNADQVAGTSTSGGAYSVEVAHKTGKVEASVYRHVNDGDFGLGQTSAAENDTVKTGLTGTYRYNGRIELGGQAYQHRFNSTGLDRQLVEAEARYRLRSLDVKTGVRTVSDERADGTVRDSDQMTASIGWSALRERLRMTVTHEQSIGGNQSADFPTRTGLKAEYMLTSNVSLFAAEEVTFGRDDRSISAMAGLKATPWGGASMNTSVTRSSSGSGSQALTSFGLGQRLRLTDRLGVTGGFSATRTLESSGASVASGDKDFTAVNFGADYRKDKVATSGMVEFRTSDSVDKQALKFTVTGEPRPGTGMSLGLRTVRMLHSTGLDEFDTDIRFAYVHRPAETRWIVLDRLDLIMEEQRGGTAASYDNWRVVNNMTANYRPDEKMQVSLQYGAKYVRNYIDGGSYAGYTDLSAVEGRYDILSRWDMGLRTALLHSWNADQYDYLLGMSVGHYFAEGVWMSMGYNFHGFVDEDFSKADFTYTGPYVKVRVKLDQGNAHQIASRYAQP